MRGLTFAMVWALWSLPLGAQARDWPKLERGEGIAECGQAFDLATRVFESGEFYLFAPAALPRDLSSAIVLKRNALNVSGDDALEADPAVFEKLDHAFGSPVYGQTYWERRPHGGVRLVVSEALHGWRGSIYEIFLVPDAMTLEAFAHALRSGALPLSAIFGHARASSRLDADDR